MRMVVRAQPQDGLRDGPLVFRRPNPLRGAHIRDLPDSIGHTSVTHPPGESAIDTIRKKITMRQ